jgi:hypothetical protein
VSRVRFREQLRFLIVFVVVAPTLGHAEPQSTGFTLVYSAPAQSCPSRKAFAQAISLRAPSAREVPSHEATLTLDVRLQGTSERAKGSLRVHHPDGSESQREVSEGACTEVAESLAIIVAMLLEQREFPEVSPAPADDSPQSDATTPSPGPAEIIVGAPAVVAPPRLVAQPPPRRRATPLPALTAMGSAVSASPVWGLSLTLATTFESEASPSPALGLLAGVEGWWERDAPLSPSARLAAYQIEAGREVTNQGDAQFRLRALRLSACPLRFRAHARLAVHVCAVFDGGELWTRGEVPGGKTLTMPWFAAGAGGRLALKMLPFLHLDGEVLLQTLSRHDEFVLEPNAFTVHSVAPVTFGATLGLTLRTF